VRRAERRTIKAEISGIAEQDLDKRSASDVNRSLHSSGACNRLDLVVEGAVIVEIKAVERLERVHSVQLLSYLRFAKCPVGLLFNFHAGYLTRDGLKRVVNSFPE
jgi:GxxExxY protein